MLPKPGSQEWEDMVDFMRADLDSGMKTTRLIISVQDLMKQQGRDFDEEFKKWKKEKSCHHQSNGVF